MLIIAFSVVCAYCLYLMARLHRLETRKVKDPTATATASAAMTRWRSNEEPPLKAEVLPTKPVFEDVHGQGRIRRRIIFPHGASYVSGAVGNIWYREPEMTNMNRTNYDFNVQLDGMWTANSLRNDARRHHG